MPCFWHQDPDWCFSPPPLHGLHQCEAGLRFTPQDHPEQPTWRKAVPLPPLLVLPLPTAVTLLVFSSPSPKKKSNKFFETKAGIHPCIRYPRTERGGLQPVVFSGQQCQLCCHSCFFQQPQPSCCGMRAGLGEEGRFPFMSQQNLALPGWGENSLRWCGWEPRWGRCP